MKTTTRLLACSAILALVGGSLLGCRPRPPDPTTTTSTTEDPGGPTTTVDPGQGGNIKGPNPSDAILTASRGPFAVTSTRVGRTGGFAGGTLNYPTENIGRLGAMVIVPGFMSAESSIAWWGPRLASHGFVVMTIATNSTGDFPPSRATQQRAALNWLGTSSPAASRVDPTRLAAGGWSMGGGGSLIAAGQDPNIKVVVPMAPWNPGSRYTYAKPTFILSCSSDAIAGNASNSNVFYSSLTGEKAQLTLNGGHFCPTSPNTQAAKLVVSWLKRFLDGDTRYSTFACPSGTPPGTNSFRSTCPV